MVPVQGGPHSLALHFCRPKFSPKWLEGQVSPNMFSREALFSSLSTPASYQQLETSAVDSSMMWQKCSLEDVVLRHQRCKTKPKDSAGMIKQTTTTIKKPRSHGDIPHLRPPGEVERDQRGFQTPGSTGRPEPGEGKSGVESLQCGSKLSRVSGLRQGGGCFQPRFTENATQPRRHRLVLVRLRS